MTRVEPFASRTRVAYLSMEIALEPAVHTYSGGLGVLAGDTAYSAADLNLPMVFVTLVTRQGYFRQVIDADGNQTEEPDPWDPAAHAVPLGALVAVTLEGRSVWIRPWFYELKSPTGGRVPVLLLDTDVEQNDPVDRDITDHLYGGDETYRLKQEIVLGMGGPRILQALGFDIRTFHMNEGHAALLTIELLNRFRRALGRQLPHFSEYDYGRVRDMCVFTTHTPVEAGHDKFSYELVNRIAGDLLQNGDLKDLGGTDHLNMTKLALNLSNYVNGVARKHADTTRHMFPGYEVRSITNGVHPGRWAHPAFCRIFDENYPVWHVEPEALNHVDSLPDETIWQAHMTAKHELADLIRQRTGTSLDPDLPTLGYARRMTGYKRPGLLFRDPERLLAIAEKTPFQIVIAGKAHPRDATGKAAIHEILGISGRLADRLKIAYLPNYNLSVARHIVSGVDIWLNTPMPPLEASGTSGMKAALNGALNFSTLDGWWAEGCLDGVTGWAIGDGAPSEEDGEDLYRKLEGTILPLYHDDREKWIWMMKQSIGRIGSTFNTQRMMRRYGAEAYLR
ncbi:alpha-glucan family phosphorylase [Lutibaculum baratangense]|uniref:alpha-glucan family phosphorylase n=1 Tax=Lutibaculum baratangense TaxID=1358440 RepID=UPI00058F21A4|nr:alpha-glucan family phosphorylase [Lutibaculum baratangense]